MGYIRKPIFYNLIIAIIIIAADISYLQTDLSESYSAGIGWLGLITIIWCGLSLYKKTKKLFSLVYMFEISFYIFTMGQSLLCALGMEILKYNQYIRESYIDANTAYIYTILCLVSLHIGILLFVNSGIMEEEYNVQDKRIPDYKGTMRSIGWLVFLVAFIPYCYEAYSLISVYLVSGYAAAFESISGTTSWAKVFSLAADYFPFAVFMLLVAYKDDRFVRRILTLIIFAISAFNFSVGNRSEPICYIMAWLWYNSKRTDNAGSGKIRNSLQTVIIVVVLLLVIPVIGANRNTGGLSIDTIVSALVGNDSVFNTVFQTISDLGYSSFPLIKTMQLIPGEYNFHYGVSYFFAFLAVFPNIFGGIHISVKYAALAKWLMNTLEMTSGPGYSMPAEAFYNFGWAGFMVMPFFGYFIARLLFDSNKEISDLKVFSMLGSFIVLFSIPRRDALTAFRNLVYYVGLLCLVVFLFYKRYLSKNHSIESETEEES